MFLCRLIVTVLLALSLGSTWAVVVSEDPLIDRLRTAQQLIVEQDLESASRVLVELQAAYPEDPRVFNFLGVISAQKGEAGKAEFYFLRAIDLDHGFLGAYLNLGRLYQENLGSMDSALTKGTAVYSVLLELDPANVEANFQLALLLHLQGRYAESEAHLGRLPEADRVHARVRIMSCANLAALGERKRADETAERLVGDPTFLETDLLVVLPALRKADRDDLAVKLLESIRVRGALSRSSTENLGLLLAETGRTRQAVEVLDGLAETHPDLPALLVKMGWVAFVGAEYKEALSYLAHARDLRPDEGTIHLLFGLACMELGLGMEAVKSFERALEIEPDSPSCNLAYGVAVMHWKEAGEAVPILQRYAGLNPEDPRGSAFLGQALFLNNEYAAARERFEQVLEVPELSAMASFYLGVIAKVELRLDEAFSYLEQALELRPDYADALAELGDLRTRKGEYASALESLERALELDPEHYLANFNLLKLYTRTQDERREQQQAYFDQLKEKRWERLTDSLKTIEVVPRAPFGRIWRE